MVMLQQSLRKLEGHFLHTLDRVFLFFQDGIVLRQVHQFVGLQCRGHCGGQVLTIDMDAIALVRRTDSTQQDNVIIFERLLNAFRVNLGGVAGISVFLLFYDSEWSSCVECATNDIAIQGGGIVAHGTGTGHGHATMESQMAIECAFDFESDKASFFFDLAQLGVVHVTQGVVALVTVVEPQITAIDIKATTYDQDNLESEHPGESNVAHEIGKYLFGIENVSRNVKDSRPLAVIRNVARAVAEHASKWIDRIVIITSRWLLHIAGGYKLNGL
mmetsp:Transcript_145/g.233  ORF Transcript_145/g.233 Transcript_145/m.233 type:complete len:273 (+) Transcript_145:426-1244(+)